MGVIVGIRSQDGSQFVKKSLAEYALGDCLPEKLKQIVLVDL
jgi:hypothetical protein